jgi:PAS domain S-box-containing protein
MSDLITNPDSLAWFRRRIVLIAILLNLLIYILAGFSLFQSRTNFEKKAAVSTQNVASVLDRYIDGEFGSIDMALISVKYEAEWQMTSGGIDKERLDGYITRMYSYLPQLQGVRMTNSRGDIIYGTGLTDGVVTNIADRDYFVFGRDNPKGGIFISKPVMGRITKNMVLNVGRRVNNPDGTFAGVVFGSLAIDHISKIFSTIDVGKKGSVSLRDGELGLIARYPDINDTIGSKKVSQKFSDNFKAGNKSATYRSRAGIDNVERMISYRKISDYPLYIVVALAKDEYLADWRKEIVAQLGLVAFFTLVTIFASRMLLIRWRREKDIEAELRKAKEELELRVEQRTVDLNQTNEQLKTELRERIQAEKALNDSRQQLEDIIDFLPDATFVIDNEKRIIAWNRAMEEMTGVRKEEILGQGNYACTIPFYGERRPHLLDLLGLADEELQFKYRNISRKGETLYGETVVPALYGGKGAYVWAIGAPLYNADGKRVGAIESIRDISEKKASEDALRLNEARLESLLRISQYRKMPSPELLDHVLDEAVQLTQSQFGYIYHYDEKSQQFTLNSWSKDVIDGCSIVEKQTLYELEKTGLWGEAVRQRQPIIVNDFKASHPLKKGYPEGHAPLSSFLTIPVIVNDEIVTVVSVANKKASYDDSDIRQLRLLMDAVWKIIEQQKTEELRSNDLAFIETLLHNSPAGIRVFDVESGQCVLVNQSAADIAGGTSEALLDENFRLLQSWKESGLLALAEQVISDGIPRSQETVLHTSFNKIVPVTYQFSRFNVRDRLNLLVIGRDVSEEKRLADENKRIEEQMLHSQKLESMGVLAGGIAHDFNNILTSIIGNADLALMRLNPESPVLENLQRIENAAGRAAELAKQMLAYSGRGKFIIENIDMNRLVEEMLHMLEVSISKSAVLRLHLHRPLPTVEVDATQIRQVIMNLVINASEAIDEKSGVIAITSGCMECDRNYLKDVWLDENLRTGLYVYLEIADTGCGMDNGTMEKIFDPFYTTKFTGRGLGMAAVLGIVRGHKGAIKVFSEPGKGSSFKILLPASGKPEEIFNVSSNDKEWQGSGTVLLVDDEETIRAIGSEMLRELGFQVVTAEDGRHALEIFKEGSDFSFVILDLTMPHMDGEQTFRELRRIRPDIPIIMSSGYNEQEVTQRFIGKGLAGFIQKPYKLTTFMDTIRNLPV